MDANLETQKYFDLLNQLLSEMRSNIESQSRPRVGTEACDRLDDYLLELNSYYYESFVNRYWPDFRKMMTGDLRDLHNLNLQDGSLKRMVLQSIKQQAKIFNQGKTISAQLRNKHRDIRKLALSLQHDLDSAGLQLIYIWKEFSRYWTSFLTEIRKMQNFLDDKPMVAALTAYPALAAVGVFLQTWTPPDAKSNRDLNRLIAAWQLGVRLLAKSALEPFPGKETCQLLVSELEKIDSSWDNRKTPAAVRAWYQQHVQKTFQFYLDVLRIGAERNDRRLVAGSSSQMQEWLQTLLVVLEKGLVYRQENSAELISHFSMVGKGGSETLRDLVIFAARILQGAEETIGGLTSSPQASYSLYSQRCSQVLAESIAYLEQNLESAANSVSFLAPQLRLLKDQLELLAAQLELWDEQAGKIEQLNDQYRTLLDSLDAYLLLLQSIQEEQGRVLDARHLRQLFPEMDLHLEHLIIASGSSFPRSHQNLVDEGWIKTQASDAPENRVLFAAGDIFIARLDGQEEREIPEIIIARKG